MNRQYKTRLGLLPRGSIRADGWRLVGLHSNGKERWTSPRAWKNHIRAMRIQNQKRNKAIQSDPIWRSRETQKGRNFRRTHLESCLWYSARARAKKLKIECTIMKEDIHIPKRCPVLGFPLKSRMGTGKMHGPDSPTLDRIDPKKGYILGNILVISHLANKIKTNATPEQIIQVGKFYAEIRNQHHARKENESHG